MLTSGAEISRFAEAVAPCASVTVMLKGVLTRVVALQATKTVPRRTPAASIWKLLRVMPFIVAGATETARVSGDCSISETIAKGNNSLLPCRMPVSPVERMVGGVFPAAVRTR